MVKHTESFGKSGQEESDTSLSLYCTALNFVAARRFISNHRSAVISRVSELGVAYTVFACKKRTADQINFDQTSHSHTRMSRQYCSVHRHYYRICFSMFYGGSRHALLTHAEKCQRFTYLCNSTSMTLSPLFKQYQN